MATVTVTFAAAFTLAAKDQPLPVGSTARTETIDTEATDAVSSAAAAGEHMVRVTCSADCWVAIGENPDPSDNTDGVRSAWLVKSGAVTDFLVSTGQKVAAEAAA